jgi:creatinine amidohydrolase/Fe(II)-dependent formamide hydrolase-like protein
LDIHAGKGETSVMLKVTPDLVEMERIKDWKPSTKLKPEFVDLLKKDPKDEIDKLLIERMLPPLASEVTDTGVYGFSNPNEAQVAEDDFDKSIKLLAEFVNRWKDF